MNVILKYCLFLLFVFWIENSNAQLKKYGNFLKRNENTRNSMFTGFGDINIVPIGQFFRAGNGVHVGGGINVARFFSRKIVLGVLIDIKPPIIPVSGYHISDNFKNEFNTNFTNTFNSSEDSINGYSLKDAVNKGYIGDNNSAYWGIMFSPFPQKYGGLMFKYKKGTHGGSFYSIVKDESDTRIDLHIKSERFELSFRPFLFFKNLKRQSNSYLNPLCYLQVGAFYENFYFKNATIGEHSQKISSFLQPAFFNKYGNGRHIGFTVGMAFY